MKRLAILRGMKHPRSIVRHLTVLLLFVGVAPLAGCWIPLGESWGRAGSTPDPLEPIVWPERNLEPMVRLAAATPDEIFDREAIESDGSGDPRDSAAIESEYLIRAVRLTEHGLLRVFDERFESEEEESFAGIIEGFAANARFLSSQTNPADDEVQEWIDSMSRYPPGQGLRWTFDDHTLRMGRGIDMYIPDPDQKPSVRGIVLHYRGLVSTSYEEAFVDQIVDSEWLVVRIGTFSRIATDRDERFEQRNDEQSTRRGELIAEFRAAQDPDGPPRIAPIGEIFQQVEAELPDVPRGFDVTGDGGLQDIGRIIANRVDDTLAENAYAAEAAIEYLDEAYPSLRGLPIAIVGCSAGAISSPAVAARLADRFGDRLSAIVMVGGGADIMRIDRGTALTGTRRLNIFQEDGTPISSVQWREVNQAYRDAVQLDPVKVGPRLRHVPTLIIRAGFDKWVPASTGSEMVRAFGKPDRDWHPGGHQTLFYFLEGRAPRVLRWLDKNTPEPERVSEDAATVAP